ncbi:MAG: VWA domain-containing protein [Spirochaetaceae bacterium]|nr:VWA domain-containing protein [Spirochaetaceae bacterium]
MKKLVFLVLFFIAICNLHPQNNPISNFGKLAITQEDILIEETTDGGYHLYIKAKDGIGSVMITESTADTTMKNAVYALRAQVYNPINGDEKRILDGKEMSSENNLYFLIDSTPEPNEVLGMAFHIFIPYITEFGYPWTRNGDIYVAAGTFLNIRSFEKKFGDYSGAFMDNPFVLDIIQLPSPKPPSLDKYAKDANDDFSEIAKKGKGEIIHSTLETLLEDIGKTIEKFSGPSIDLVFAIDTTESMGNDFVVLKKGFGKTLDDKIKKYEQYRVGLVFYKDYKDEYLTKTFPFTTDTSIIKKHVESVKARGGGDRPEAVYEALYESVTAFSWEADDRVVILIGDAPPHPKPRGKITKEMVFEEADKRRVSIFTILLPP